MADGEEFRSIAARLDTHLRECASMNVETAKALVVLSQGHTAIVSEISGFKKILGAIGAAVLTAAGSLMVQNYAFHKETTDTTRQQAAVVAARVDARVRYTAADAANDRAAQDIRDKEIIARLAALNVAVKKGGGH